MYVEVIMVMPLGQLFKIHIQYIFKYTCLLLEHKLLEDRELDRNN